MSTEIDIEVSWNEDLLQDFYYGTRSPGVPAGTRLTVANTTPYDFVAANALLYAQVRTNKGGLALTLSSGDTAPGDPTITIESPGNFQFSVPQAKLKPWRGQYLIYDLLLIANGITKRMWGGNFTVDDNPTSPPADS